jgi:hypothetical protein
VQFVEFLVYFVNIVGVTAPRSDLPVLAGASLLEFRPVKLFCRPSQLLSQNKLLLLVLLGDSVLAKLLFVLR